LLAAPRIVTTRKTNPLSTADFCKAAWKPLTCSRNTIEDAGDGREPELHSEQLRSKRRKPRLRCYEARVARKISSRPNPEYTLTLAEIVEAQHQIQIRHLESDEAMAVVAERIARITNASGAAIEFWR